MRRRVLSRVTITNYINVKPKEPQEIYWFDVDNPITYSIESNTNWKLI